MKKDILVKKNSAQRTGIRTVTILFSLFIAAVCFAAPKLLLCLSGLLPVILVLFYYESWSVRFSSTEISRKIFFTERVYTYHMLVSVFRTHSVAAKGTVIRMIFSDGKSIRFRTDDDNAPQAVKRILSHKAITDL